MSEIGRLLRVAADRNRREEYTGLRVRLLRRDVQAVRARLAERRMSLNVLIEALLRGYLRDEEAVQAMVDEWIREEVKAPPPQRTRMASKEIDEIYAAIEGDMMAEEEK